MLYVEVNQGRWLVRCQSCSGAEPARRDDQTFWCRNCQNAAADGARLPVVWPADPDAVTRELRRLPPLERNWQNEETS